MNTKTKVFVEGYTSSVFIKQLYSKLDEIYNTDFEFYFRENDYLIKQKGLDANWISGFVKKDISWSALLSIKSLSKVPLGLILKFLIKKILYGSKNPITWLKFLIGEIKKALFAYYIETKLNIDVVHFQTIGQESLRTTYYYSKKIKKVVSVWGSDLLRVSNPYAYQAIYDYLRKVDVITIANINMQEFLLVKYGRELKSKIQINSFIPSDHIYNIIDSYVFDSKQEDIRDTLNIKTNKKIILVGHSGDRADQHLEILKVFENKVVSSEFTFVLPLAYGLSEEYKIELEQYKSISSLNIVLQTKFLDFEELVKMKLNAEYVIMTPISDANSAFLRESIYAGSKCITGIWLPYGRLREIGLSLYEVSDINDIPAKIEKISTVSFSQNEIFKQRKIIRAEYLSNKIVDKWAEILQF